MSERETSKLCMTVLVEEEERVRRYWREFFASREMPLAVFDSSEAFLAGFRPTGDPVRFFFDQDMGNDRGVGVRLAEFVRGWPGRQRTCLVTAYPPECFLAELAEGVIGAVYPKYPQEIFGERYFEARMLREFEERGMAPVLADSLDRITDAYAGLCAAHARELACVAVGAKGGSRG